MNAQARKHWNAVNEFMSSLTAEDLKPMEDWLAEYPKKNVVRHYKRQFTYFLYWSKKSPKQLMEDFDNKIVENQILQYQTHLLDHYAKNTARTMVQVVRAFYTSQVEPVRGLKRKVLSVQLPKQEHAFTIDDLRAMHNIANTEDKAILSLACSLGYHVKSFLGLEREFIENLVKRAKSQKQDFIQWFGQRGKTSAYRLSVLSPIALYDLEKYLNKTNENKNDKLFTIDPDTLNNRIRSLVEESGIVTTGKITFKLIRKWLMQALNDAGLTEWEVKLIMGKSIGTSDLTYLQTIQKSAFEKYKKAYPLHLSLSQQVNGTAKYNELVDLVVKHVKAQKNLVEFMKSAGYLERIPPQIQKQLTQVTEFAKIMEKKNGDKPKDEQGEEIDPRESEM